MHLRSIHDLQGPAGIFGNINFESKQQTGFGDGLKLAKYKRRFKNLTPVKLLPRFPQTLSACAVYWKTRNPKPKPNLSRLIADFWSTGFQFLNQADTSRQFSDHMYIDTTKCAQPSCGNNNCNKNTVM